MMIQQFDYSIDFSLALLWQYDETNNLLGLLNAKQAWYDLNQTAFWQDWYTNVFNLLTADDFGLAVWSYILNLPLYTQQAPEPVDAPIWGFSPQLTGTIISGQNTITGLSSTALLSVGQLVSDGNVNIPLGTTIASIVSSTEVTMSSNAVGSATEKIIFINGLNFGNSNFSSRGTVIILTEEEQRFILRLKYFELSNRGDITDINAFLNYLITTSNIGYNGTIYALDGLNMTMTYVFTGSNMSPALFEVLTNLDLAILPRPAGVGLRFVVNSGKVWGFNKYINSFSLLGTLVSGMNTITGLSSTSGITVGMRVSDGGVNIPNGSAVASIVSGTEVTITNNATGNATESITFTPFTLENSNYNFGNGNFLNQFIN